MSMTDPIADLLTRIRNAAQAKKKTVDIPASNLKRAIVNILVEHGYITDYVNIEDGKQGVLRVSLKYIDGECVIANIERASRPGLRRYVGMHNMPRVLDNLGIAIVSTSKGVMTNKEAKRQSVGGEVLCYVW